MKPAGLYIHIPFCEARCHYCDFVTFVDKNPQIEAYLSALEFEISLYQGRKLSTLFIGGGTPTVLTPVQIEKLLRHVRSTTDCTDLKEATVEANPESASAEKLQAFMDGGINRLSFGLQTTSNPLLSKLGRLHDRDRFFEVFYQARRLGYTNINVDLMFGLPDQTLQDWEQTLEEILGLQPEHISTYSLKIEPGTEFYRRGIKVDEDLEAEMYLLASEKISRNGYSHYEISNFARRGRESQHNLLYWQNAETIGVGVSSTSYMDGKRIKNTSAFRAYLDGCLQGNKPARTEESLDLDEKQREDLMLGLRLKSGVALDSLKKLHIPAVDAFLKRGLASVQEGKFSLTPQGWLLSNQLFHHFVS